MKRTAIILTWLGLVFPQQLDAGGPPYSRFGIGDLIHFASNRAYAMGILGVSLSDDGQINLHNPSGLSRVAFTRIAGGFEYRSSSLEDASGTQRFATGGFQSLALAVPVSTTHGIVMFAGTRPTSTVNYDIVVTEPVAGNAATQTVTGSGGLSQLFLGSSFRPAEDLALGFRYEYHHGTIAQRLAVDFDDGSFSDNELRTSQFYRGSGLTLGMTYDGLHSLISSPSLKPFSIGFTFSTPVGLSVKEERILLTQTTSDTALVTRGSARLPAAWSAGVSYNGERLVVAADLGVEHWSSANFFRPSFVEIRNNVKIGLGVELPARRDPVTYWDRVAYRAGFSYTASYLSVNGQPVNGWTASGGIGLPIGPDARLNLGLQFGSRGSTENGLIEDSFFRLSLSFDAGEAWFITIEDD
jgi:hypothetical protein